MPESAYEKAVEAATHKAHLAVSVQVPPPNGRELRAAIINAAAPILEEKARAEVREALKEQEAAYRQEARSNKDIEESVRLERAGNVLYTTQLIIFGDRLDSVSSVKEGS